MAGPSPGGGTLASSRYANGRANVWLYEINRHAQTVHFRRRSISGLVAGWRRIVFCAPAEMGVITNLYEKSVSHAGSEELLFESSQIKYPEDWSPDGHLLLYSTVDLKTGGSDIWALPLDREGKRNGEPMPVIRTPSSETGVRFSPDGKWIAYESDQSGRFEVYVRPFPGPGGDVQISNNGAAAGRSSLHWRQDGMELFYIAQDGKLMAVPIRLTPQAVESKLPVSLFSTDLWPGSSGIHPSADGTFSYENRPALLSRLSPIALILN
jgi:WD40 repeat protein